MMKTIRAATMAATAALGLAAGAHAAPVALLTPVAFDPATDERKQVRDECNLGDELATRIGGALKHVNHGPGTTTSTDGDVVRVTVTSIWGARGNNWTGPKGLVLHVELLHDGKPDRSIDLHRTTLGGVWGAFKGICSFMSRDATALGKDIARWTRDPGFQPEDDGAVPEAASEPRAASDTPR